MQAETVLKGNLAVAGRFLFSQLSRFDLKDRSVRLAINRVCRGYSTPIHWRFYKFILSSYRPEKILVAGVYCGRDIAYICALAKELGVPASITGVDLFADVPMADWRPEQRNLSWEAAGYGQSPSLERTRRNLESLSFNATLVQGDAIAFCQNSPDKYDFIYIDTSHDYYTTRETIRAALNCRSDKGVLGGDDYLDFATWGVKSAVSEMLPQHQTYCMDFLWFAEQATPP